MVRAWVVSDVGTISPDIVDAHVNMAVESASGDVSVGECCELSETPMKAHRLMGLGGVNDTGSLCKYTSELTNGLSKWSCIDHADSH